MTIPSYAWLYEHPFHTIFSASTTILSVLSNGLLICIIFTSASSKMGSYRYLLTVFAVCDLCTSFAHTALQPIMHLTSSGLIFYPRYGPFMICGGLNPSFTNNWRIVHWVCLGVVVNIIYIGFFTATCLIAYVPTDETRALVPSETEEIYGTDYRNPNRGFILIAVRRPDPESGRVVSHIPSFLALLSLFAMFGTTAIVILYCIWKIYAVMSPDNTHFSAKTRKLQLDLFNSLLIQSAVPMVFSYLPLATIVLFPVVTGISLGAIGNVLFSITSIFPAIDAFFVMFFIRKFRKAVVRLFSLPFISRNGSSN